MHVWSPELVKPGMDASGSIHDHRFDLVSHVLHGSIGHEEWHVTPDDAGPFTTLVLTHARAAAETAYHGPTVPTGKRYNAYRYRHSVPQGYTYTFPAKSFHRSTVSDLVVTVVEKHAQRDEPARVLHPVDVEPVMAFGHDPDGPMVDRIIAAALAVLTW